MAKSRSVAERVAYREAWRSAAGSPRFCSTPRSTSNAIPRAGDALETIAVNARSFGVVHGANLRKRENVSLSNMPELSAEPAALPLPARYVQIRNDGRARRAFRDHRPGARDQSDTARPHGAVPGLQHPRSGLTGTGKETTVKSILETIQDRSTEIPSDICYVNNFEDADSPIALYLPAGDGLQLRKEMDLLVDYLDRTVQAVLESDEFKERRAQLVEREGSKGREVIKEFEGRIKKENFVLVEIRFGPMTKTELAPIVDGKPRPGEELEQMLAGGSDRARRVRPRRQDSRRVSPKS